jgi:exosortase
VVWLPVAYLVFAMPLPARMYYTITIPMRKMASVVAAAILNVLPDVTCQAEGVVINGVRNTAAGAEAINLNVAEACSGMRLLMAFLALGVAMAYLEYRPVVHRVVLLCSTIPIAIFCNMLRVLVTGLIYIYIGSQYATGMLHTVLGMVMLGVAFSLYGLLVMLMNQIFIEEDDHGELLVVGNSATGPTIDAKGEGKQ